MLTFDISDCRIE